MRRHKGGAMVWMRAALVASWLAFAASVVWRPQPGYNAWLDVGLYNVPFVLAVLACLARARRDAAQRWAWRAMGAGLVVFLAGSVWGSLVVGDDGSYPSLADALWLSFYVLAYVAIVLIVRSRLARFTPSTWLDGAVGGFGAAALAVAFVLGPMLADTEGKFSVVATNLAYPTADVLLIILLVTAGTALRNRAWSWWLLVAGLAVLCVGDIVYLLQESNDTYAEGGLLDLSWPLAVVFIGLAATASGARPLEPADAPRHLTVPTLFAVTSVGLLVLGQRRELTGVAIGLAVASIVAAAVRTALTVREVRSLADSRREARTDDLTGLANRRAFVERLDAALRPGAPVGVMIIDLDGFKEVNDSLGHDTGDDLLRIVSARLERVFGAGCVLARLGGDEFGVFTAIGPDDPVALARRAMASLDEPVALADLVVRISASIGIALHPLHGNDRRELLRFADIAMYEAKRTRSTIALYDRSIDPEAPDRLRLVGELREAIDHRQLELHYQPTLALASGRIHGVEALVRWRRADGSLCYPDAFIGPAERAGLIQPLTRAVLEQAIGFRARLQALHGDLRLSVNISGHDLLDETLPAYVTALLDLHAMPAAHLTLEITETALVADLDRARRSIDALRLHGIRISVDDFGVGYSSMGQLVGLSVDELKIDKSFVTDLATDHRMEAIVRSTVALGRALQLELVGEGVEDERSLAVLRELGCDIAQGYHLARPLPPDDLLAFLAAHRVSPVASGLRTE